MFDFISKRFILIIFTFGLSACQSVPTAILDYDTSFDFSQFKTYQWLESAEENKVVTLGERRDINAIETMLNRKGFTKAKETEDADFLLSIHTITDKKTDVDSFYRGWGYYPLGWPAYNTTTYVREYEIGTLILDIIDAKRKEAVWRGTIASKLSLYSKKSPEERASLALRNAEILLAKFPPQSLTP